MYCAQCGNKLDDDATVCDKCGTATNSSSNLQGTDSAVQTPGTAPIMQKPPLPSPVLQGNIAKPFVKSKWAKWVCFTIIALVVICFLSARRDPVKDIKAMVWDDYGTSNLGVAVSENLSKAKWKSKKVDRDYYRVTLTGFCPEISGTLSILFNVNYDEGNIYCKVISCSVDESAYTDNESITEAMDLVYGNDLNSANTDYSDFLSWLTS